MIFTSVNMNILVRRPVWPSWRGSIIPTLWNIAFRRWLFLILDKLLRKTTAVPLLSFTSLIYRTARNFASLTRIFITRLPKKSKGHALAHVEVFDMYASMINKHGVQLLIGDFNQAARKMVSELGPRLKVPIFEDCRHPAHDDCICIFSLGGKLPGHFCNIKKWQHLQGAHWPLAKHYGEKPGRTPDRGYLRKVKGRRRWEKARAKGKLQFWPDYWR